MEKPKEMKVPKIPGMDEKDIPLLVEGARFALGGSREIDKFLDELDAALEERAREREEAVQLTERLRGWEASSHQSEKSLWGGQS